MSALIFNPAIAHRIRAHLVEVEDQVQLAHIAEELIQNLDEEVDGLQIGELIVVRIYACAEEQAGVTAVDDLRSAAELDEV